VADHDPVVSVADSQQTDYKIYALINSVLNVNAEKVNGLILIVQKKLNFRIKEEIRTIYV